ncbi:MAG TPA: hypothetical protein VK689_22425, partial [Armatimonadota bacterium]|nr:hypothetical protein [Armatimonadota bacterium]
VVGANVEGSEMLAESLAQYSALMVMEKQFGKGRMRRFLRHELDSYLQGRGQEREEEQPLLRVQRQPYIHYNKGSLAFYALRDAMGEKALNRVLARFLRDKKFQQPPYTTSEEFVQYLRDGSPAAVDDLITDLFEKITLYDAAVQSATYTEVAPGKYRVTVRVEARKMEADGSGNETPAPLNDRFQIGLFAAPQPGEDPGRPLLLVRRTLTKPVTSFTFTVNERPHRAGIDPYCTLVDRRPDDNLRLVAPAGR